MKELSRLSKIKPTFYVILISIITITICSKSSFLYPFNDWMDINCFMTMGKALTKGQLPYRDIYDHKGPILYFLSALAAYISHISFIGFWVLECISALFFLLYSWKTIQLVAKKDSLYWIPILALIVYTSGALSHGGSAEEFCLPFFSYALFIGVKLILKQEHFDSTSMIIIGLTSSLVLWIKFSLLGFYLGWIIVPFILSIKRHQYKQFLKGLLFIILGVIMTSIPIILWFWRHEALEDLLNVYFFNNIITYSGNTSLLGKLRNLIGGLHLSLVYLPIPLIMTAIGVLYYLKVNLSISLFFFLSGICTGIVIFSGGQGIQYYPLPLASLCVIGIMAINDYFSQKSISFLRTSRFKLAFIIILSTLGMYCLSPNTYFMKYKREDLPQFQFKEIICQEDNPVLLNYGFLDGGFYTACEIYPTFKYFCKLNMDLPEMIQEQNNYITQKQTTFIVTRNQQPFFDGYDCIASSSYVHEGNSQTYYLYKLADKH